MPGRAVSPSVASRRSRRRPVALCLAGLTPAVVTETLYGLAVARRPRVVPEEVHIITTGAAYPAVVGRLLGPQGALASLRREYGLPRDRLRCDPDRIRVLCDERGRTLDDIRSGADSRAAGECIRQVVRALARDPTTELHCSLAGGRKTMSALLATALQLYGRPWDRLYHVLVSEPFERVAEFLYPPRRPVRYDVDGGSVSSRNARVVLVEIPFVALGTVTRQLGYDEMDLEALARELELEATGRLRPEPLVVDLASGRLDIGSRAVPLAPQGLAVYALYAEARQACRSPACREGDRCSGCHLSDDEVLDRRKRLLELCALAGGQRKPSWAHGPPESSEAVESFRDWLRQARSRINRALERTLGRGPRASLYTIDPMNGGGASRPGRRGLRVPPGAVTLRSAPRPSGIGR
ncbi:MAG TPA: CRISPR-associated ring nuclease Csm6 [Thermodesulfobacteriota bacterium]|nr:CRISPR-associated ring nuclease Csm6 [Thermodesulfobacteriota bacterium]